MHNVCKKLRKRSFIFFILKFKGKVMENLAKKRWKNNNFYCI